MKQQARDYFPEVREMMEKHGLLDSSGAFSGRDWKVRADMMAEEVQEYRDAMDSEHPREEALDALADLLVFLVGTAILMGFEPVFHEAFQRVHKANMAKERGSSERVGYADGSQKPEGGWDLVKPEGWQPPDLSDLAEPGAQLPAAGPEYPPPAIEPELAGQMDTISKIEARAGAVRKMLESKQRTHGSPEECAQLTQALMQVMETGANWSFMGAMHRETLHMVAHKAARMLSGDAFEPDHARDIAGYAAILEDWLEEQRR